MPLVQTRGAASAQGFGEFAQATVANYIEDVFSTYLYEGNNGTQTIANGIDLTGKGGLVWIKDRTQTWAHLLVDSARGNGNALFSNTTSASTAGYGVDLASNGFTLTSGDNISNKVRPYVSWTFREQPKFFDVVTYTGNGADNRAIPHSLGSAPGFIVVKRTDSASNWFAYQRQLDFGEDNVPIIYLNTTDGQSFTGMAFQTQVGIGNSNNPALNFIVRTPANANGATYVAYLFAHNAGGFGTAGTDNVISCGSFTTDASGDASVTLGYEPQWILYKKSSGVGNWVIADNMRGWNNTSISRLFPDDASAEVNYTATTPNAPTATGFISTGLLSASSTYIYIAIRRGPMKVPTLGTSVLNITTSVGTNPAYVSSFPVDFAYRRQITGTSDNYFHTRLQGAKTLYPNYNVAEDSDANVTWDYQNGMFTSTGANANQYGWLMRRAPSFMDTVCYTGTGANRTVTHNLTVVPELMIVKNRSDATGRAWAVYANADNTDYLVLNTTAATVDDITYWNDTSPTSTVFTVGTNNSTNESADTFVAYLFATCAGVSKVGSYTGNGTTQTINCGFTGGARFVLIKRTDSTGDWYVWDSARGIVAGNDPHLSLNTSAAEVTTDDSVDTDSTGFVVNQLSATNINVTSASYIFLSVA
jgi:hypothetical protein